MKNGFSVLEVILAAAIFMIFSTGAITVVIQGYNANRLGTENTIASQFASEGIEAVKSIKNRGYSNLTNFNAVGLQRNDLGNYWEFKTEGSNNTLEKYIRTIKIEDVNRDVGGNIVLSGNPDPDTKKITSTVAWDFNSARSQTTSLITYLSNWRSPFTSPGVEYIGSVSSAGNNTISGSFSLPTGWNQGDVAIFWWYTYNFNKTITCTTPCGLIQKQQAGSSGFGRIYISYRVLQSGDSTFAWTSPSFSGSTTVWGTSVFKGVNISADPFEAQSGTPATFSNTSGPNPPSVTTLSADAVVVSIFGKNNDYSSITPPAGYTTAESNRSTAGNDASAGIAYFKRLTAGTEDPEAWSAAGASTDDGYVWTAALQPN